MIMAQVLLARADKGKARAGTSVKVNTLDGEVDLKIPSGTQPGTTLVMGRRGVPRLGSQNVRGDHHVSSPTASDPHAPSSQRVNSWAGHAHEPPGLEMGSSSCSASDPGPGGKYHSQHLVPFICISHRCRLKSTILAAGLQNAASALLPPFLQVAQIGFICQGVQLLVKRRLAATAFVPWLFVLNCTLPLVLLDLHPHCEAVLAQGFLTPTAAA